MVTLNLSHCTASNNAGSVEKGGAYSNVLTADEGFVFTRSGPLLGGVTFGGGQEGDSDPENLEGDSPASIALFCSISMGGENVTTAAFDIATGEIEIEEVTGPVIVTTWTETPH